MDSVTEAALKSYREDIDYLNEQLDKTTRVIVMLAAHLGYIEKSTLAGIIKNPQRVHVNVIYNPEGHFGGVDADGESVNKEGPWMELEITQPGEDDTPQRRAALLPRHKLERAYIATHERARLAEEALGKARVAVSVDDEEPDDERPEVGVPKPPTLDGNQRRDN